MIGVTLTERDLEAVARIYELKHSVDIRNWKERGIDTCLWFVRCPDSQGNWVTKSGNSLAETIYMMILDTLFDTPPKDGLLSAEWE